MIAHHRLAGLWQTGVKCACVDPSRHKLGEVSRANIEVAWVGYGYGMIQTLTCAGVGGDVIALALHRCPTGSAD